MHVTFKHPTCIKNNHACHIWGAVFLPRVDCEFSQRRENVKNDEPSREFKRHRQFKQEKVNDTEIFIVVQPRLSVIA